MLMSTRRPSPHNLQLVSKFRDRRDCRVDIDSTRRMETGMTKRRSCHDVIVVGARCAGAATAMLLARHGHDVVVVDRAEFPSDTLSTHGIARSGVVQLSRWGLLDDVLASGAPPVRQVWFRAGAAEEVRTVKDRAGVDLLVAPRRYVLDGILADAATRAGADVRFGVTATGLRHDGNRRVTGIEARDGSGEQVELSARFVVGADGLRSRVARAAGAQLVEQHPTDNSTFYAYFGGVDWRGFEFHVGQRGLAGVFPTHGGEACVWLCSPADTVEKLRRGEEGRRAALVELIGQVSPSLADRLRGGHATSAVRGTVRMPNQVRRAYGPGWALVGDAGYHRDAITGHGISDAFRDAELLARALDRIMAGGADEPEALGSYERQRDALLREIYDISCALSEYPEQDRFVELQIRLAQAIDTEANFLASLPAAPAPGEGVAA
jgi:2-polyprenyl-6-methoxyphenol hydroxylase-like FAD-dependent oxidoreductase